MSQRFIEMLYEFESEVERREYLEEKIKELPLGILTNAIRKVAQAIQANNPELFDDLATEKNRFGYEWIRRTYFSFGVRVRNMLREIVCDDSELPDNTEKEWAFYYAQIVEMALDLW